VRTNWRSLAREPFGEAVQRRATFMIAIRLSGVEPIKMRFLVRTESLLFDAFFYCMAVQTLYSSKASSLPFALEKAA